MTFAATIQMRLPEKPLPLGEGVGDGGSAVEVCTSPALSRTHPLAPSLKGGGV